MKLINLGSKEPASAYARILVALACGAIAGALAGIFGTSKIIPLAFWDTTAIIYVVWMWASIWPMPAAETKKLAKREDPGRGVTDIGLTLASIASLAAVGLLIVQGSSSQGLEKGLYGGLGILSVILSWTVIHTIYSLKYAELYYAGNEGGIDFNQNSPPQYSDFAYLAFTLGMTFQVSDTDLKTTEIRKSALHQAQLSYFFGTIIIATTINLVVGLSSGG